MTRFLLLLLLVCGAFTSGVAQLLADADSPEIDRAKAHVWYATASYIWEVKPGKAPNPKPTEWQTVDEFRNWFKKAPGNADKSGLATLKNGIFGDEKHYKSSGELADAIVKRAGKYRNDLSGIDHARLKQKLDALPNVPTKQKSSEIAVKSVDSTKKPIPNAPAEVTKADTSHSTNPVEGVLNPELMSGLPSWTGGHFWRWLLLTGAFCAATGLLAGFLLVKNIQNTPQPASMPTAAPGRNPTGRHHSSLQTQLDEANNHNDRLRSQKKEWSKQQGTLEAEVVRLRQLLEGNSAAIAPVAVVTPDAPPTTLPPTAVAATPVPRPRFYASAAPGGVLEKVESEPSSRAVLLIEPDPANSDRASFGLNPDVDQVWMTGIGFPAFRDYFEDASFVGAKSLSAARPGQLKRQGSGWQVETKARLNVR